MSRCAFNYLQTKDVLKKLDEASRRSGASRAQAFDDLLLMTICALSGGRMENQYLETVKRYKEGPKGRRGCDSIADAFGALFDAMQTTRTDILGDLFQGAFAVEDDGQVFTPDAVCELTARMLIGEEEREGEVRTAYDPCCGSGRMLLAAAALRPDWEFIGQDRDLRCIRMTAINLALRGRYGYVLWGDSLAGERRLAYGIGFDGVGVIREIPPAECPLQPEEKPVPPGPSATRPTEDESHGIEQQHLF